jgi:hypothetical protein
MMRSSKRVPGVLEITNRSCAPAPSPGLEAGAAPGAEVRNGLAGAGVEGVEPRPVGEQDAFVVAAFPVGDAPAGAQAIGPGGVAPPPDFLASGCVHGEGLRGGGHAVEDAVDDDRVALHLPGVAGVVFPGYLQPAHVAGVDLRKRGVVVAVGAAQVFAPIAVLGRGGAHQPGQYPGRQEAGGNEGSLHGGGVVVRC